MSKVKYKICSKCGAQMQIEEGVMTTSIPPMYRYHCPVCGGLEFDTEMYPVPEIVDDIRNYRPFQARVDWDAFRMEAAKDILCSLLNAGMLDKWENLARTAIKGADELIKQLRDGKE